MGSKKKQTGAEALASQVREPKATQTTPSTGGEWPWLQMVLLVAVTFLVMSPSLRNGFVNWDDDRNVYENKTLDGPLNTKKISKIFQSTVIGNYNPLTIFSFAVEKHFFGKNTKDPLALPKAMHRTNLILHLACTLMVFFIFMRLGLNIWIAFLGALLFGIHPMRVESVAWITERKDVLFATFFFAGLILYLKNLEAHRFYRTLLIFLLFVAGLFAKIQMVSFPLTLLVIDYWKGRPLKLGLLLEKWYFFLAALAFGLLGIYFLRQEGSLEANEVYQGYHRIFIGTYSLITYLIKWLVPYMTLPLYPYPEKMSIWHFLSIIPFLGVFAGLYIAWKKNYSGLVFGFMFFFVNIAFLLQVLGAGQGYLADRFTYVAYTGLFFIACFYLQGFLAQNKSLSAPVWGGIGVYLGLMAYLSYRQCTYWKDSGVLWTRVIEFYDNTPLPFNNRANFYRDARMYDAAMSDYSRAIQLKADHPTYNSRAKMYFEKNENEKALADYNVAITKKPLAEYYVNRGAAYARLGRMTDAMNDFNKGLEIDPAWKVGYLNRSIMYQAMGDFQHSFNDIEAYIKLDPYDADLWYEGARCLRALNRTAEALPYYNEAIRLNPRHGLAYLERGRTHQTLGNASAAQADLEKARSLGQNIEPENPLQPR